MKKLFLFLILFFLPQSVIAAGEFQVDYDVNYAISPAGITIVTQNITLTNKLTNLYPKRYNILIDSDRIKNVLATDEKGGITPSLLVKDGKTEIVLSLNTQNAGIGKKTSFTLRYEHGDVAHKNGRIWEVTIPGVENDADLSSYRVSLAVPVGFGPVAYLNPAPINGYWTKEQMTKGGITAAYGTEQIFALDLSYFLENNTVAAKESEIALPPDTAYQTVAIHSLEPKPKTVVRDSDGNWLARYDLTPGQKLNIQAALTVSVFLHPKKEWVRDSPDVNEYLKPLRFWEIYDAKIQSLAQKYRTPREIYDYVVATLSYDYQRVSQNPIRFGAAGILASPKSAICMEFTDLFIAIARAAGIPAREIVGYAYTTNSKLRPLSLVSDVLHAWPEYYDSEQNIWIPIDPTWADTTGGVDYFDTFDFNHITFAIHGSSSEYPYPAGFYRNANKTGKDIQVRFVESDLIEKNTGGLSIDVQFPRKITGGMATGGTVVIKNENNRNVSQATITIQSSPGDVQISKVQENIPPYGIIRIPVTIKAPSLLSTNNGRIVVGVDGNMYTHVFTVLPIYWILLPVAGSLFVIFILVFLWKFLKR